MSIVPFVPRSPQPQHLVELNFPAPPSLFTRGYRLLFLQLLFYLSMVFFVSLAVDNAIYLHRLFLMLVSFSISAFIHTSLISAFCHQQYVFSSFL